MSEIKVAKLKEKLQNAINDLNKFDDNEKLSLEPNTYFLNESRFFVGIAGYDGGYLDLDNVAEHVVKDDDTDKQMCERWPNGD